MKKFKSIIFKSILIVIGLCISCGIVYTGISIFKDFISPDKLTEPLYFTSIKEKLDYNTNTIFRFHPKIQYVLKTNHTGIRYRSKNFVHQTDSRGFLGTNDFSSNPETKKILLLGDSILYGKGVKFDDSISPAIQTAAGNNFQFMNAACPEWTTYQELLFFENYLTDIKWDAVVILVNLNDILKFQLVASPVNALELSKEWTFTAQSPKLNGIIRDFANDRSTKLLSKEDKVILSAWLSEKWEPYFNSTFIPFIKKYPNLKLVVAVAPTATQIISLRSGAPRKKVLFPQLQLKKFCEKNSILFIDISKAFESKNHDLKKCYLFPDTIHFDKLGNNIVGKYIWSKLNPLFL